MSTDQILVINVTQYIEKIQDSSIWYDVWIYWKATNFLMKNI